MNASSVSNKYEVLNNISIDDKSFSDVYQMLREKRKFKEIEDTKGKIKTRIYIENEGYFKELPMFDST